MPYLESISPSRSTMLEDSTRLNGESPLTESGKARLVRYGLVLTMASKRVHFCQRWKVVVTYSEIVRKGQTRVR